MPRPCSICQSPDRDAIDKALAAGEPFRGISRTYFGSANKEDALSRHKDLHLPATVARAEATKQVEQARGVVAEGLNVVAQLRAINSVTFRIMQEARDRNDGELALKAIDRVQRQIELQAKLLGDLDERPVVNILVAPAWIEMRTVLMQALQAYPEARIAVAAALTGVERGNG